MVSDRISSMNFKFVVNKGQLIYSALLGDKRREFSSPTLKNKYFDDYNNAHMLFWNSRKIFTHSDYAVDISFANDNLVKLFNDFEKTKEFKNLYKRTEEYKSWLETQWKQKKDKVRRHLKEILKIELPNTLATVFVIEKNIGGGAYLGNNIIYWGHTEDWKNYSLVYLAHEFLHTFLPNGDLEHAVIELATDNELRLRLNGKGKYFEANGERVGHQYLLNLEKDIYQRWLDYLGNPGKNILQFIQDIKTDSPF